MHDSPDLIVNVFEVSIDPAGCPRNDLPAGLTF